MIHRYTSTALVGYTGFVGSNLVSSKDFDGLYNSKNISDAFHTNPDLLIYSGVHSAMFLANNDPSADYSEIIQAQENIRSINPKKLVLISTVAVYESTVNVNEKSAAGTGSIAYGRNRFLLEQWVQENIDDYCIVRLPALFGENLKKNFLYDYIHLIPSMLSESKFNELAKSSRLLNDYYCKKDNGFYCCKDLTKDEAKTLRDIFSELRFSALNFTDSRSTYQYYDLSLLWEHIQVAVDNRIQLLNLTSYPINVCELFTFLSGNTFENILTKPPIMHNVKTIYSDVFSGKDGYILNRENELERIRLFVAHEQHRLK